MSQKAKNWKDKKPKAEIVTREYTIHLHKLLHNVSYKRRAPKAIKVIKHFTNREMGTKDVRVDPEVNKFIWSKGIKNVPFRIRVRLERQINEDEEAKERLYTRFDIMSNTTYGHYGLVIFILIIGIVVYFAHFLRSRQIQFIHETGIAIIFGLVVGLIINYSSEGSSLQEFVKFQPEVFFLYFLPQIIFESGYNMKRKSFFKNSLSIFLFAFVGTLISTLFISFMLMALVKLDWVKVNLSVRDCLIFGSLVSATDPVSVLAIFKNMGVPMNLFANVFGESIMNDAIAIVLVKTFLKFDQDTFGAGFVFKSIGIFIGVFLGSLSIGIFMGMFTSLMLKHTRIRDAPALETSFLLICAWFSFFLAEEIGLSGIASVVFCGIVDAHYSFNNLSDASKVNSKQFVHILALVSELFIFIYLGLATFSFSHSYEWALIGFMLLFCFAGRALNIYPLSWINNRFKKPQKRLKNKEIFMIYFSGLRGAIAFALSLYTESSSGDTIITTTLMIVFFMVFICGGLTPPLLKLCNFQEKDSKNVDNNELQQNNAPKIKSKSKFLHIDRKYIKPFLTNKTFRSDPLQEFQSNDTDEDLINGNKNDQSSSSISNNELNKEILNSSSLTTNSDIELNTNKKKNETGNEKKNDTDTDNGNEKKNDTDNDEIVESIEDDTTTSSEDD
ncbi:sodium/hydrogen exchanger [Anaeramoeba flamelloides]|uniref:Sodium/hydrogen exchanger n=1 Tax=Anaeramoeba flamelloides TaxID=1746091 RepID=A0ABQ8Z659_9EUKA|nr:sodium/hydrogen exchanger [Anaeramoeba flamelloides]